MPKIPKLLLFFTCSIILAVIFIAQPALAGNGYWDLFAVDLNPTEMYWNQVNGGNGSLSDPLVSPDPGGTPVIDLATALGGVAYGYGGYDWSGTQTLETESGGYSIELKNESDYYLSIVLDTKTWAYADSLYPSWGSITDIVVSPWTGTGWGTPIVPNWVLSPFDPGGGTALNAGASSSVSLGTNDVDDLEYGRQISSIFGVSAHLPAALGYKVDFTTDLETWDSYAGEYPSHFVRAGVGFSVDGGYYNALRDGISGPAANPAEGLHPTHASPDDVYSLGSAGGHNLPTEGEIFQSSGDPFGAAPDGTNADRISGALGVGVGPHAPPPAAAPSQTSPGALGLDPNDNINGLSYGKDGGDTLHFSVDPDAAGQNGTDVRYQATLSPAETPTGPSPENVGGDPGNEAAGDIFVSEKLTMFGKYQRLLPCVAPTGKLHTLELDEKCLGLQAPANTGTVLGAPEDDLDALEMSDAGDEVWGIDIDVNGLVDTDPSRNAFFSLDPWSPSVTGSGGTINACDILVTRDETRSFFIYADGVDDIDLLAEDNIDALVISDITALDVNLPDGFLDPGLDEALFSLSRESPTLWGADGAPGVAGVDDDGINGVDDLGEVGLGDDLSPGDVFYTSFFGSFGLYVTAEQIGLLATDELNALDIAVPEPTTMVLLALGGLAVLRRRK